jgi:hypothetical protein
MTVPEPRLDPPRRLTVVTFATVVALTVVSAGCGGGHSSAARTASASGAHASAAAGRADSPSESKEGWRDVSTQGWRLVSRPAEYGRGPDEPDGTGHDGSPACLQGTLKGFGQVLMVRWENVAIGNRLWNFNLLFNDHPHAGVWRDHFLASVMTQDRSKGVGISMPDPNSEDWVQLDEDHKSGSFHFESMLSSAGGVVEGSFVCD